MEEEFDVLTVGLQGSKLIEASAGTGKTYSIAILVLRLIIEKHIPIEKILMVTFTKAAVSELESRIRKFIRLAFRYSSGKEIEEDTIKKAIGEPGSEKTELLLKAVRSLDSLSVMTINSFCQKTIDEFTFETGQSFDYEIVTDDLILLKDASNKYFREVLNILDPDNFNGVQKNLKFEKMHQLLKKHLSGMKFIDSNLDQDSTITTIKQKITAKKDEFDAFLRDQFTLILAMPMKGNALLNEARAGNVGEFKRRFSDQINKPDKSAAYFSNYKFMEADFLKFIREIKRAENEFVNFFYLDFFSRAEEEIKRIKLKKGSITYDDQIKTIYRTLSSESFKEKLAKKYQAVFIDEFQDTDKHQYEIFSEVFSENSVVFYIGDPKQAIYGWRGADLDTYKQAKKNVDGSVFSMNKNYRSTKKMIDALNILMNPDHGFNMFMDDEITYVNVGLGKSGLGPITDHGSEVLPITNWNLDTNDFATNDAAVSQEIYRLLTDDVKINGRKITPKDIGVLVRDNKEGDKIKKSLARLNIPSVKRDETKVLNSDESALIKYLLNAVISPERGAINRALKSTYTIFSTEKLITLDEEKQTEIFIGLRKILTEEGVYNMILSFLRIYGVRKYCMKDVSGQRVLTNINQLAEILHKIEKQFKYTPDELLIWMDRSSDESNEEYEQRVESDDEAVQISTIHKAKGLEYNIVFAPCLSIIPKKKFLESGNVNDFKKDGEYFFTLNYPLLSPEDKINFGRQKEQENRRLIYVALTRAVYKCYISLVPRIYGSSKVLVSSSLSEITDHYQNNSELIEIKRISMDDFESVKADYKQQTKTIEFSPKAKPEIEIKNTFGIHSFSALSKAHHSVLYERTEQGKPGEYDQFIFDDLGRGANVGTALHSIFERLDYNNPGTWEQTLEEASKYYSNIIREERMQLLRQMVTHMMNVEITCNAEKFALNEITNEQKITELEFCFSMDNVNKTKINEILGDEADLMGEADIEGLMTGFIDLFFEHKGKYYILDWKSNYLGNAIESYGNEGLNEAMKSSNYNLQYMIYTIAVKRWLETKIENFDYTQQFGGIIYLFLRGVRDGHQTGIFTTKPGLDKIESLEKIFKNN